jgi:cystathionine gamma-synthase
MTHPAREGALDSFLTSGSSPPAAPVRAPQTTAVRAAIATDPTHGAVTPPLFLSSNYTFAGLGEKRRYDYTRSGNPTRDDLGRALAELEGGAGGVVCSTGMSAVLLALQGVRTGELVIAPHDCYGGTYRLLSKLAERGQFAVEFVNQNDPVALARALAKRPRLFWIETPSNPLLRVYDVRPLAALAHEVGACVVVDNTFLSPALQRPIALGADLVVHSTTKYINGHSDVVGGAVIAATEEAFAELTYWANCLGLTGAPFDAFLTLRGLRTLHARLAIHQANAKAVVALLTSHPAVARVHYPGLASHPGHEVAKRQQSGFGAMVSFEVHGGIDGVRELVDGLSLFTLAESLGGVESLIAHPATMTHAAMDPIARRRAGIDDGLVRLSVGIEAEADLVGDLARALDRALALTPSRVRRVG